jgi:hypothetical protein
MEGLKSLNEVHDFVVERLHSLLLKSNKILKMADKTIDSNAA